MGKWPSSRVTSPAPDEVDERERRLRVRAGLEVLPRARDDLGEQHLGGHVVPEEVLELGHAAHDLERRVALVDDRGEGPLRLGEATRRVGAARGRDALVLVPAQPGQEPSHTRRLSTVSPPARPAARGAVPLWA